jgi:hypothetical protein
VVKSDRLKLEKEPSAPDGFFYEYDSWIFHEFFKFFRGFADLAGNPLVLLDYILTSGNGEGVVQNTLIMKWGEI